MNEVTVLLPVKRLDAAKSRLAGSLNNQERRSLVLTLLVRTIRIMKKAGYLHIVVVSDEGVVKRIAENLGCAVSGHPLPGTLNEDMQWISAEFATESALLFLPIDLPSLAVEDIVQLVEHDEARRTAVIVSDLEGKGTNALFLPPGVRIRYAFGRESYPKHILELQENRVNYCELVNQNIMLDLDCAADLVEWAERAKHSS